MSMQDPAPGRERPLGTAHAVLASHPAIDGVFAVFEADDLDPAGAVALLAEHLAVVQEVLR